MSSPMHDNDQNRKADDAIIVFCTKAQLPSALRLHRGGRMTTTATPQVLNDKEKLQAAPNNNNNENNHNENNHNENNNKDNTTQKQHHWIKKKRWHLRQKSPSHGQRATNRLLWGVQRRPQKQMRR